MCNYTYIHIYVINQTSCYAWDCFIMLLVITCSIHLSSAPKVF